MLVHAPGRRITESGRAPNAILHGRMAVNTSSTRFQRNRAGLGRCAPVPLSDGSVRRARMAPIALGSRFPPRAWALSKGNRSAMSAPGLRSNASRSWPG